MITQENITTVSAQAYRDQEIGLFFAALREIVKLAMPLVTAMVEELKKEQAAKRRQ